MRVRKEKIKTKEEKKKKKEEEQTRRKWSKKIMRGKR